MIAALLLTALAAPPNVVLIISDDQAWTDYGFMGHPAIETPHLDRLAATSVCYPRGYVPDSLCRPSLVTIVTGHYPHRHGIVGNDPPVPEGLWSGKGPKPYRNPAYVSIRDRYVDKVDRLDTMADMLGRLGYASHQSGKWWEGHFSRGGFTEGMTHGDRTRGGRHGDEGLTIGREGMDPVFDFIDRQVAAEKPFHVYYAPFLPHSPHNPPERLLAKYRRPNRPLPITKYYAMCDWFDETCGQLLDKLDSAGVADNTVVLYVCDNGWIQRPDSPKFAARSKRSPYEGGIRTPIMVRAPGVQPRVDQTPVSSIDLVPTMLAAIGEPVPDDLPGVNLLDESAVDEREAIFGEIFEHDVQDMDDPVASLRRRWVVAGGWKLIVPYEPRLSKESIELFHLELDPQEATELSADRPEKVAELQALLDAWWSPEPLTASRE